MTGMTPRERVLTTFAHKEPDRLPVDMFRTACCLMDPAYFTLRDHLGLKGDGRIFRNGQAISYYDERILEILEVDFRRVWLREPINWQPQSIDVDTVTDEWGLHLKRVGDVKRVLFASDYPWYQPKRMLELLRQAQAASQILPGPLAVTDAEVALITDGNARRVLNLA